MNDTAVIIDGKKMAEEILKDIKLKTANIKVPPTLAIILVGNDPASEIYVKVKKRACQKVGIFCQVHSFDEKISESDVVDLIKILNANKNVAGIIVQLPLPDGFNTDHIINAIAVNKDVDGLTEKNVKFIPATAKAVLKIIESFGIVLKGKKVTVIGRSKLVGKPVAELLSKYGCEIAVCHSKTVDLGTETRKADIIVSAVGKRDLVTKDMVKKGAIIIDIGITRDDGKLYGDVSYDVRNVAGYITPVPGGVGPLTVACLLENVVESSPRF